MICLTYTPKLQKNRGHTKKLIWSEKKFSSLSISYQTSVWSLTLFSASRRRRVCVHDNARHGLSKFFPSSQVGYHCLHPVECIQMLTSCLSDFIPARYRKHTWWENIEVENRQSYLQTNTTVPALPDPNYVLCVDAMYWRCCFHSPEPFNSTAGYPFIIPWREATNKGQIIALTSQ